MQFTVKRRRKCLLQSARSSWYRLENENGDEKICGHAKNPESRRRQRQSGAAENRAAGLTARRCDAGLKWTWFEAALLDFNGSLPYTSINVTECHCSFLHLQCQHCGASTSSGVRRMNEVNVVLLGCRVLSRPDIG